jgi:hypothetical protein
MIVAAGFGLMAVGCVGVTGSEGGNAIVIKASDFAYDAPASIPGGLQEITLENTGNQGHALVIAKLGEGKTPADIVPMLEKVMAGEESIPEWLTFPGGIAGIEPGDSATAVIDLEPGNHAIMSLESGEDGVPDAAKGMLQPLTVTEADNEAAAPETDLTVALNDFSFAPSASIPSGPQMWQVDNDGKQLHEAIVLRLAEGVNADDLAEMMMSEEPPEGPPPFTSVGGTTPIDPGGSMYTSLDLDPGNYVLLCFVPDPADNTPHFAKGMVHPFTIE